MKKKYKIFLKKIIKIFKNKNILIIIIIIFIFLNLLISIKIIIFNKNNEILDIKISDNSKKIYFNSELEKLIISNIPKNIIFAIYYKNKLEKKIKKEYPLVNNLNFIWNKNENTLIIDLNFKKPDFIFFDWENYIWYKNKFFFINKKSKLLSWKIIYLPEYMQKYVYYTGIFYEINPDTLIKKFDKLTNYFNNYKITYFPWWNIAVVEKEYKIILNLKKNLDKQLKKYEIIKNKWIEIKEYIDLGSNDKIVFIK